MTALDLSAALTACRAVCEREGVDLYLPGDPRREAVVLALGAYHRLRGGAEGWDVDAARQRVSVAVPSLGVARTLLASLPVVGDAVRLLPDRAGIYLSPAAMSSAPMLLGVVAHELGHHRRVAQGGLLWCVAYGVVPEARAADEAACYGQDIAARVLLGGEDPDVLADACEVSLSRYGLDKDALDLARGILGVARRSLRVGAPLGGPLVDLCAELRARGVALPEGV